MPKRTVKSLLNFFFASLKKCKVGSKIIKQNSCGLFLDIKKRKSLRTPLTRPDRMMYTCAQTDECRYAKKGENI